MKLVCPSARKMPVTLNSGVQMPAWFDLKSLDPAGPEDVAGVKAAAEYVNTLIEAELEAGISSDRIVLAGFSQGGALSLYTALLGTVPTIGTVLDVTLNFAIKGRASFKYLSLILIFFKQ